MNNKLFVFIEKHIKQRILIKEEKIDRNTQTDPVKLYSTKQLWDSEVQVEPFEDKEMREMLDLMNEYDEFRF